MIYLTQNILLQINPKCNTEYLKEIVSLFNQYMPMFELNKSKLRVAHFLAQIIHETDGFVVMEENWNYNKKGLLTIFPKYFNEQNVQPYVHSINAFNKTYANRMGNGNENSQDGSRYRGRGIIQLTGKESYERFNSWYIQHFPNDRNIIFYKDRELYINLKKSKSWIDELNNPEPIYKWIQKTTIINNKVNFLKNPELIATNLKYAVLSSLWEFCIDKKLNKIADEDNFLKITYRINGGYNGLSKRRLYLNRAKKALANY